MDRKRQRAWYRRRPFQIAAAVAVLGAAALAGYLSLPQSGTMDIEVRSLETGEVVRAPYQDYVPLRAEAVPLDTVYITAAAAGRVQAVAVSDGDTVAKGQALVYLVNPALTLDVSAREADISARLTDNSNQLMALKTAQENREQALADASYALSRAEQELQKRQTLREKGFINDAAVKPYADEVTYQRQRVAALKTAQTPDSEFYAGQRRQVQDNAQDLRRNLGDVRRGLDALTITAPAEGRLTAFGLKPGQAVKEGDPVGQVDSEGRYKLRAEVDEFYLQRLSEGQKAEASLHGQPVGVAVSKVFPQVTNGRVVAELQFVTPPPADLKRGETVDIRLKLGQTAPAILAPTGSWLTESGGAWVFVLNAKGDQATRRAVTVGRRNPEQVEILSGLRPGERIVTAGVSNLRNAQHLRLKPSQN
ncbi:efflux RND transporter periplasmic adaptor subunit [Asticcacaulis sp. AND118]|uniref:efflux RND transporter periplasmic adaptor subunit n=1 Tax=Asticcacaulis sp. AND118 TaxID=2840468 RepID=UPI001CFFFAF1|nr:efflux RND transporter periplasmic adaptor subunit [Asticcacaulis sp. AND118]UDF05547.1 efflux RND transporter periplasmic adaptor subunit [Asticcacaulis sp. AND118]